jgi:predicted small lipoprotein YifL
MKKVRTFRTRLMAIVMVLMLAVSLAGCGKDDVSAKPPTDDIGQVAGETQDQTLEGTYRTEQTPPTGLGTELTFTADGKVTDNTGDGAGTYKIEGDKLTIEYQGIKASYAFSYDGNTVVLNGVKYVSVDGSESEYEPYTPSADDPYPGLIIGVIPSGNSTIPDHFVIDLKKLMSYVSQGLKARDIDISENQLELKFNNSATESSSLLDNGSSVIYGSGDAHRVRGTHDSFRWTEEYGLVERYSSRGGFYYEAGPTVGTVHVQGENIIIYSVSLGRPLTPEEYGHTFSLSDEEAYELWPDDYLKYTE